MRNLTIDHVGTGEVGAFVGSSRRRCLRTLTPRGLGAHTLTAVDRDTRLMPCDMPGAKQPEQVTPLNAPGSSRAITCHGMPWGEASIDC